MTQLRVEKEDKGLSSDTPFIFYILASTLRCLLTFKSLLKKTFSCTERGVGFDMGKKEKD